MLTIINSEIDRKISQAAMMRNIKSQTKSLGIKTIGFPGGNLQLPLYKVKSNSDFFYSYFKVPASYGIERHWNAFGFYDPSKNSQDIAVEINVALKSESQSVAAFFARNSFNKRVYLLHSGRIGGGLSGVGRNAFLAWSGKQLAETFEDSGRPARLGIIIGPVDDVALTSRLKVFSRLVRNFKQGIRDGSIEIEQLSTGVGEYVHYAKEFAGRKRGFRQDIEIDYISRHGDIVHALRSWRTNLAKANEFIGNTGLIDLYVKREDVYTELYEIKTSTDRQTIYTALGQLLVHSTQRGSKTNVLVIPVQDDLPHDIDAAIIQNGIKVMRYKFVKESDYKFEV